VSCLDSDAEKGEKDQQEKKLIAILLWKKKRGLPVGGEEGKGGERKRVRWSARRKTGNLERRRPSCSSIRKGEFRGTGERGKGVADRKTVSTCALSEGNGANS